MNHRHAALRIGLTGGIGSGKSTVAALWAAQGAAVFDTDAIARHLALPGGAAMPAITAAFGSAVTDASGGLNRDVMRALVFADATARQRLEGILHPLIGAEVDRLAAASSARVQIFDVPLLVESGRWRERVDRVLVVDCREATQVARVMQRSGWAEATVHSVIAQQASRAARRASADAVLHNDGIAPAELAAQVATLSQRWVPAAPA